MSASNSFARIAGRVLRPILGEARPRAKHEFRTCRGLEVMEDRIVPTITDFAVAPFIPPGNNFQYQYPNPSPVSPAPSPLTGPVLLPKPGHGQVVTTSDTLSTVPITNETSSPLAIVMAIYNDPTGEAQGGNNHNLTAQKLTGYEVMLLAPNGQAGDTATLSIDVSQLKLNGDAGERAFQCDIVTITPSLLPANTAYGVPITVTSVKPHDPLVDVTGGLDSKIGNGNNDFYFNRLLDGEIYNNSPPPL